MNITQTAVFLTLNTFRNVTCTYELNLINPGRMSGEDDKCLSDRRIYKLEVQIKRCCEA